jgi:hypothetical protein
MSDLARERQLTDEQWGRITTDFVDRMGFAGLLGQGRSPLGRGRHGLPRSGDDHIHIAVSAAERSSVRQAVAVVGDPRWWDETSLQDVDRVAETAVARKNADPRSLERMP